MFRECGKSPPIAFRCGLLVRNFDACTSKDQEATQRDSFSDEARCALLKSFESRPSTQSKTELLCLWPGLQPIKRMRTCRTRSFPARSCQAIYDAACY